MSRTDTRDPGPGGGGQVVGSWWPRDGRPGLAQGRGGARSSAMGMFFACFWLAFLIDPVVRGWQERSLLGWVGIAATAAFATAYVVLFNWVRNLRRAGSEMVVPRARAVAILLLMTLLAAVMVLALHDAGMSATIYLAVASVMALPTLYAVVVTVTMAAAVVISFNANHWSGGSGLALGVLAAGLAMWGIVQMMQRNLELLAERERNADLAVVEERSRMARDLHDILGHSLTVITVKAELAGRLMYVDPARARAEVADLERLSRDALADVRRTVEGYRQMSLPVEIVRARNALGSAGIDADLPGTTDAVRSDLRELFAWVVREGVTNVIRHSHASTCTITLEPCRLVVGDDGTGAGEHATTVGHGLSGLRERAERAGALVSTRSFAGRGFTLEVSGADAAASTSRATSTGQPAPSGTPPPAAVARPQRSP